MSRAISNPQGTSLLALAIAMVTMPAAVLAQDHASHHPPEAAASAEEVDTTKPASTEAEAATEVDHSTMDHSAMGHAMPAQAAPADIVDHSMMDHSMMDHSAMGQAMPAQAAPEETVDHSMMDHSAMGHAIPAQDTPADTVDHSTMDHAKQAVPEETVDHSTMDHSAMGHAMPAQAAPEETVDHSTMDHSAMGHDNGSPAPTEPRTPIPVPTDADRAAAVPPAHDHPVHDDGIHHYLLFNRLEGWDADPGLGTAWEAQGWIGTDLDRMWLRSEGERVDGHAEGADLEVLYGHSIARWWDVVAGVRHDFKPGASQDFLAVGVIGLAPYKFEVQATAYLGESGRSEASIEVEYETLLTNRLILQPLVEISLFGQDDEQRGVGSGLGTVEAGLRLRYEVTRQFAPYVGLVHERAFGRTARLRREEGELRDDTRFVAGVRFWF